MLCFFSISPEVLNYCWWAKGEINSRLENKPSKRINDRGGEDGLLTAHWHMKPDYVQNGGNIFCIKLYKE